MWTKDGIPIENSRISYSFNDSWNRTLALISANITYTGVYSCHVDLRSGGYPTVNASAKVVVHGESSGIILRSLKLFDVTASGMINN